jgi:hypothetical protein
MHAKCLTRREDSVQPNRELIPEDACSIREGLWRMVRYARDATESLDARIAEQELVG